MWCSPKLSSGESWQRRCWQWSADWIASVAAHFGTLSQYWLSAADCCSPTSKCGESDCWAGPWSNSPDPFSCSIRKDTTWRSWRCSSWGSLRQWKTGFGPIRNHTLICHPVTGWLPELRWGLTIRRLSRPASRNGTSFLFIYSKIW